MPSVDTAWAEAERAVYRKLCEATGADDGDGAFLGAEPDDSVVNWWALTSGGGDATEDTWAGCFAMPTPNAQITGLYAAREEAQRTAGLIQKCLADTSNLNDLQGTNVHWFRMFAWPQVTQRVDADGEQFWALEIPCQLVYSTSTTY